MDALILSGGGSFGAFEAGVLYELIDAGMHFNNICGTSVGSLNSLLIGQSYLDGNPSIFEKVWTELVYKNSHVYKKNIFKYIIRRPPYSYGPMKNLIKKNIDIEGILSLKEEIHMTTVDLPSGKSFVISNHDPYITPEKFFMGSIASASVPPVFKPVYFDDKQLVDGGIRENVPTFHIFNDLNVDSAIIILCSPADLELTENKKYKDILEIAGRTIAVMMNEITINDVRMILEINNLLKDIPSECRNKWLQDKKWLDLTVIEPKEHLEGGTLNFDGKNLKKNFMIGRMRGKEYVENPCPTLEKNDMQIFKKERNIN